MGSVHAPVEVGDLVVTFGGVTAVDGLALTVRSGTALALLGRNGAGKSTTMRVLGGVIPPTSGTVRIAGVDVSHDPLGAKHRVGYCPDTAGLIPRATPWEHLQLAATLRSLPQGWQSRGQELLERFDLADAADRVTSGFSHGMARRLSVLLAAFHRPPVLLLDEPFDGVDPLGVEATMTVVAEAKLQGSAVVISTHLLNLAVQACDEALVLRRGQVVRASPADELAGSDGADRYRAALISPGEHRPGTP